MAPTVEHDGDQTATINTEHTLATLSGAGTRVLAVDLSALAGGDLVVLRIKAPVRSGGTQREVYRASFSGPTAPGSTQSPPAVLPHGGVVTLQQTAGTPRTFPWAVYAL
ncbi:hypothetical protein AB0I61_17405 [Polymorphospora rubra]|uniref:hypothetical protein n=1 Tax=Polymorphospora rubra TaxID=338584 RepID=UPI0033DF955B